LARGFGAAESADLFASTKANETQLMSVSEIKRRQRGEFGDTLVRQMLYATFMPDWSADAATALMASGEERPYMTTCPVLKVGITERKLKSP
jgi:hypothetical protein